MIEYCLLVIKVILQIFHGYRGTQKKSGMNAYDGTFGLTVTNIASYIGSECLQTNMPPTSDPSRSYCKGYLYNVERAW